MWLGWDHCGYDTIDDEPRDPENSMAWQPPPSGRGERGTHATRALLMLFCACFGRLPQMINKRGNLASTPLLLCWWFWGKVCVLSNTTCLRPWVRVGRVCACDRRCQAPARSPQVLPALCCRFAISTIWRWGEPVQPCWIYSTTRAPWIFSFRESSLPTTTTGNGRSLLTYTAEA